jgi:uncharacterized protein
MTNFRQRSVIAVASQTEPPAQRPTRNGHDGRRPPEFQQWVNSTRVVLQPVAAPSVLGLFGFAIATFMVSTNIAGWYGGSTSPTYLFPLASVVGGVAQFSAGMWAYRARDTVATAVHGVWGSFWIAYGILWLLVTVGALHLPGGRFPELAFWFFPLAAVTASCAVASLRTNLGIVLTLCALAVGAALLGVGYDRGSTTWLHAGGWVLFASAVAAFYSGSAMMWRSSLGRVILPLGEPKGAANVPGHTVAYSIEFHDGEPGVRQGQ